MPPSDCPPWVLPESASDVPSVASGLIEFQKFVYKNSSKYILQHGDLKTWHERIFRESVPVPYYAGNYRSDDSARPCLRQDVVVGGVRGTPFAEVPRVMREWSEEMRRLVVETDKYVASGPIPVNRARAVVQLAALLPGKFLQIHPFLNCNGRTSRLISNYILHRYGYPMPYYNPYPRPGAPYENAAAASMVGNFVPMFQYLLGLLAAASP
jgi:fido (protein-threonine AMPylation protein)